MHKVHCPLDKLYHDAPICTQGASLQFLLAIMWEKATNTAKQRNHILNSLSFRAQVNLGFKVSSFLTVPCKFQPVDPYPLQMLNKMLQTNLTILPTKKLRTITKHAIPTWKLFSWFHYRITRNKIIHQPVANYNIFSPFHWINKTILPTNAHANAILTYYLLASKSEDFPLTIWYLFQYCFLIFFFL